MNKDYFENKYFEKYIQLMEKAQKRNWTKKTSICYVESHHIYPKSWLENTYTVELTAKEHFFAHRWIHKAFPQDRKMNFAYWSMKMRLDCEKISLNLSAKYYIEMKESLRENMRGNHLSKFITEEGWESIGRQTSKRCKGIPLKDSHKKSLSEATLKRAKNPTRKMVEGWEKGAISRTGRKMSKEFCEKTSDRMKGENNPMFGKKRTKEMKQKSLETNLKNHGGIHSSKGRKVSIKSKIKMRESALKRNKEGENPLNEKRVCCLFCLKKFSLGTFKKYHGDNCKRSLTSNEC
jgi:hypothetical protein